MSYVWKFTDIIDIAGVRHENGNMKPRKKTMFVLRRVPLGTYASDTAATFVTR